MLRLLLPLAVLVLAPSCFFSRGTINVPLRDKRFVELVPGRTTAAEVVVMLGSPAEVVQLAKRSAYRYEFTQTKTAVLFLVVLSFVNTDARADRAWLFFDEQDVLTHVATSFEADDAEYAMPWFDLHD